MKLGARILKTGIAVTLALFITKLFELPSPAFAGIAAIFAIQPSIYRTYQSIIEQIQANLIGAVIALLFVVTLGNDPFVVGLTVILVISIILRLKIEGTMALALVTVVAIMESPSEKFVSFSLLRFNTIMIGVFSSFLVNLIFMPPKYETKLYHKIVDNTEEIIKWIRVSSRNASEHSVLKEDIDRFREKFAKMDNLFLFYKEERNYFKKKQFSKARKLVLFRQMMMTTQLAFELLKKLHKLENEYNDLPKEVQLLTRESLDSLTTYHEHLLNKFIGKNRTKPNNTMIEDLFIENKKVIQAYLQVFYNEKESDCKNLIHTLPLLSSMTEYHDSLHHLNHLIESFQNYHKEDNEVNITEKE